MRQSKQERNVKAARLYGARDVRIEEIPMPEPGPGQVLVRVRAVSICPSDWRLYTDGHAGGVVPERPIIQGHEFSGDVSALGDGVTGLAVGMRVAVEPTWPCGDCDMCRGDRPHLCRRVVFPSFPPHDGALAEYIVCPAASVCPLPDNVGYAEGALVEPLGVAIHAVRLACLMPGETVAILGAGTIGICTLFLARMNGPKRVAIVEPVAARRVWPRQIGADPVVGTYRELLAQGFEADVVFECSGDHDALGQATLLARPDGRIVVIGIPRDENITFDMSIARRRELTVIFSRRSKNTLVQAVELAASRRVDLKSLPVRRYSLEQTAKALESAGQAGPALRALVEPFPLPVKGGPTGSFRVK
jgi:L-iditol 2-dehydrogenase